MRMLVAAIAIGHVALSPYLVPATAPALARRHAATAARQSTPQQGRPGMADRRPISQDAKGTALIRGRVVNAETGRPLKRASVIAASDTLRRTATTDDAGQFQLTSLPAGRYILRASAVGFVPLDFGEDPEHGGWRDITLADGEKFVKAEFQLPRGGVITGVVVDEEGEPVEGVQVRAMGAEYVAGLNRLVPAATPRTMKRTNDLGRYRIFGLQPGSYYVVATTGAFNADPPANAGAGSGYVVTFFPGTADVSSAQQVTVSAARDTAADFALVPSRTFEVSGTVLDSSGRPWAGAALILVPGTGATVALTASAGAAADGSFSFSGVAPGQYVLQALPTPPVTPATPTFDFIRTPPSSFAAMTLTVVGDTTGIALQGRLPRYVRGEIVLEGGDASSGPQSLQITPRPVDFTRSPMEGFPPSIRINNDWTFEIRDAWGAYVLDVATPPGWALKAVRAGGADLTDKAVDFDRDSGRLQIVLTTQVTEIAGSVTDEGRAVPYSPVVVFASDPARWDVWSRFVRLVNTDEAGHFTVAKLPPGDYRVAAPVRVKSGNGWKRPDFLEPLVRDSVRVVLREGEHATADLRVARSR